MPVLLHRGVSPRIHPSAFIADGAFVIGRVDISEEASIWFNAVLRGDINAIFIGKRSNVQDGCIFHVTSELPVVVGDDVTIGHGAIIHGCQIDEGSLIGMGAVVLDRARVGKGSLVAAGALVREGFVVPEGMLVGGVPAKVMRALTPDEKRAIMASAAHYVQYSQSFRIPEGKVRA